MRVPEILPEKVLLVLPLSVVENSFSPHRLTILLDPVYSSFHISNFTP
jgi:hypothetical protein